MSVISINNLKKYFKVLKRREGLKGAFFDLFSRDFVQIKAVDGITFEISEGEIVGFLGPNGAGKSTTIKMMTGVLEPSEGNINIIGFVPYKNREEYVRNIGVVLGQRTQLWWELPVIESFKLQKEIYNITDRDFKKNLSLFESLIDLTILYNKPVRNLSLGQRMLCDIVSSFLHNPKVIFLDEPTIGLDVTVKNRIRQVIQYLNENNKTTIILTTHDISDVEFLCKRIILIDKGKIIYDGPIESFKKIFGAFRTIKINILDSTLAFYDMFKHKIITQFPLAKSIQFDRDDAGWIFVTINESEVPVSEVLTFIMTLYSVHDVRIEEINTEKVIAGVYEGKLK
jgi:ABC-type uncharacterized transport system ATPase subunit